MKGRVRRAAIDVGLSEALTFGVHSRRGRSCCGGRRPPSVVLKNPLTEERAVMRTSLLPGLLEAAIRRARRHGIARRAPLRPSARASSRPIPTCAAGAQVERALGLKRRAAFPDEARRPSPPWSQGAVRPSSPKPHDVDVYDAKGIACTRSPSALSDGRRASPTNRRSGVRPICIRVPPAKSFVGGRGHRRLRRAPPRRRRRARSRRTVHRARASSTSRALERDRRRSRPAFQADPGPARRDARHRPGRAARRRHARAPSRTRSAKPRPSDLGVSRSRCSICSAAEPSPRTIARSPITWFTAIPRRRAIPSGRER